MPIGKSGGRSRGNKTSAEFRASKRERDLIDPPGLAPEAYVPPKEPVLRLTARGESLKTWAFMGVWSGMWSAGFIVVLKWWGVF